MKNNPFAGPKSLEEGDDLFGRDRETKELRYLLSAERIVLLYSPSGAGKSSMVAAGLVPQMRKRVDVWPVLRVGEAPPAECPGWNRYVWSVANSLGVAESPPVSLVECVSRHARSHRGVLLVFDQFEEYLRFTPGADEAKEDFLLQLAQLLRDDTLWVLFLLREDYLAQLDSFAARLPTRLKNRFRIDLLDRHYAAEAMRQTTLLRGVTFEGADALARDLSGVSPFVEPLALQVVCQRLWDDLPDAGVITETDVATYGKATAALADYYARQLKSLGVDEIVEAQIRIWFEHKLISRDGARHQLPVKEGRVATLDIAIVRALEACHLLRKETRSGSYELAHDRLIPAIREDNNRNLTTAQKQAALWQEQNHPESLLLRGRALHEAKKTPGIKAFLKASRRAANLRKALAALVLAVISVFVMMWVRTVLAERASDSRRLASLAMQQRTDHIDLAFLLSIEAGKRAPTFEARSALLAMYQSSPRLLYNIGDGERLINFHLNKEGTALATLDVAGVIRIWDVRTGRPRPFSIEADPNVSFAFDHDSRRLGVLSANRAEAVIFDAVSGKRERTIDGFDGVLVSPGLVIASFDSSARLTLHPLEGGTVRRMDNCEPGMKLFPAPDGFVCKGNGKMLVYSIDQPSDAPLFTYRIRKVGLAGTSAVSADGTTAVHTTELNTGWVLRVETSAGKQRDALDLPGAFVVAVALSPSADLVAIGDASGHIYVQSLADGKSICEFAAHSDEVQGMELTSSGLLASMAGDGLRLLQTDDLTFPSPLPASEDSSYVAANTGGTEIAVWHWRGELCRTELLDGVRAKSTARCVSDWKQDPQSLAWSPDGRTLAALSEEGALMMWKGFSHQPYQLPEKNYRAAVFLPEGNLAVVWPKAFPQVRTVADPLQVVKSSNPIRWPADRMEGYTAVSRSGLIAEACLRGSVCVWQNGRPAETLQISFFSGPVSSVAFSPDGTLLAAASEQGDIRIVAPGPLNGRIITAGKDSILTGHSNAVKAMSFSSDGAIMASTSWDDSVRLWDVPGKMQIGLPWKAEGKTVRAAFTSGRNLAVIAPEHKGLDSGIYNLSRESQLERVCRVANRNLTQAEWQKYVSESRPYEVTCAQFPRGN